eukprot:scaffold30067_cov49-Attheya_sp.AAC.1
MNIPSMALLIRLDLPMSIRSNPADFSLAAVVSSTATTSTSRPFPFSVESTTPDLLDFADDDHQVLDSRWVIPTRTTRVEHSRNARRVAYPLHDLEHSFYCKSGQHSIYMSGGPPPNDGPDEALYYSTERNFCDLSSSPPRKSETHTTEPLKLAGMSPPRISHSSRSTGHLHEETHEESQELVGSNLLHEEDDLEVDAPIFDRPVFRAPVSNSTPAEEALSIGAMPILNNDPRDLSKHARDLDTFHYEESQEDEDEDDKKPAAKQGGTFVPLESINQVLGRKPDETQEETNKEESEQSSSKSESAGASSSSAFSNEEAGSSWSSATSAASYARAEEIHQEAIGGGSVAAAYAQDIHQEAVGGGEVEQQPEKLVKGEKTRKKKSRKRKSPDDIPRAEKSRAIWFERLDQLKDYKEEEGDCMVPQKYKPNLQLGIWVNKQRMEYTNSMQNKNSSMSEER